MTVQLHEVCSCIVFVERDRAKHEWLIYVGSGPPRFSCASEQEAVEVATYLRLAFENAIQSAGER